MKNIDSLFIDIQNGDLEGIKTFLGEDIDRRDNYGRTPLINAAFSNQIGIVKWLLENGASVNHHDKNGYTALHFAAQEAHFDVATLILDSGAAFDLQDKNGNTPAWVCLMNWRGGINFELLKCLVDRGADLELKNNAGRSVLELLPDEIRIQLGIQ